MRGPQRRGEGGRGSSSGGVREQERTGGERPGPCQQEGGKRCSASRRHATCRGVVFTPV